MATYVNISSEKTPEKFVSVSSNGRLAWVISDLHLTAGLNEAGNYQGTENFYYDQSFVRFVDHLQEKASGTGGLLIINGDFVDFSRITNRPYTFIAINPHEQPPCRKRLQRWNDDAGHVDTMILNDKL